MTVIGCDRYSEDMLECYRYRPSKCHGCGARTLDEASKLCRPTQTPSGDYSCPGDESYNPFGTKWDTTGRACELTRNSAKREARLLDSWCAEMAREDQPGQSAGR